MRESNDLSITRLIDAPVDRVWSIITERLTEWWCPKPWTTEIVAMDWHAGGRSAMVMHGPNGERHAQEGVFLEVVPGKRFVFTDAYAAGWVPQAPFMTGIFNLAEGRQDPLHRDGPPLDRRGQGAARGDGLCAGLGCGRGPACDASEKLTSPRRRPGPLRNLANRVANTQRPRPSPGLRRQANAAAPFNWVYAAITS